MAENTHDPQAPELFSVVLRPHRSLTPGGFLVVMGLFGGVSFIAGVAFLLMGAWPVVGFLGLDVLLVYVAFRLNYRSGRLYETVRLTPDRLELARHHPSGRRERFEFNPYWTRVLFWEGRDGRTSLTLRLHDRAVPFGGFLNDDERRSLAESLAKALHEARGCTRV